MNDLPEDVALKELEARLAERLVARVTTIDREALLYQAGWRAAVATRPARGWWPAATGVMTAATVALAFVQLETEEGLDAQDLPAVTVAEIGLETTPLYAPQERRAVEERRALPAGWTLLAAWGLIPSEPLGAPEGHLAAYHRRTQLLDATDPGSRSRVPSDSSFLDDEGLSPSGPSTACELMQEWLPKTPRATQPPAPPSEPTDLVPQQRTRLHSSANGGPIV